MDNRPFQALLLMLYIGLFLTILSVTFPDEVSLASDVNLKIPKITHLLFPEPEPEYADIDNIVDKYKEEEREIPEKQPKVDTSKTDSSDTHQASKKRIDKNIKIQYPNGNKESLHSFFRALQKMELNKSSLRILHYGDSQLEGDRITAALRTKLQEEFGGCGVGMTAVMSIPNKPNLAQSINGGWQKYAIFGQDYSASNSSFYGLMGNYYKYYDESSGQVYFRNVGTRAENVKVLYRNTEGLTKMYLNLNSGSDTQEEVLTNSSYFSSYQYDFPAGLQDLTIEFVGGNPQIYGFSFDCNQGVQVDNIALRGSSVMDFAKYDAKNLKKQLDALDVELVLLQFGVNVVPGISNDYSFYGEMIYQQIKYLQNAKPDINVLVIGVSDMSRRMNGNYESYPNIELIRDAQKKAAFRAGCPFWDLYEAMGGKNSMPSWVEATPKLATSDYTHFTSQGADVVAEMFYRALIYEYDNFLLQ